jgi:transposase
MGSKRKTYSQEFKLKAVEMYLNDGIGYKTIARELDVEHSMVLRWVKRFRQEGLQGLAE